MTAITQGTRHHVHGVSTAGSYQSWMAKAACIGADPELFYPVEIDQRPVLNDRHKPRGKTAERRIVALSICARCSVAQSCLEWALAIDDKDRKSVV